MNFLVKAGSVEVVPGDVLSPLAADMIAERERRRVWLCASSGLYLVAAFAGLAFIN